MHESKNANKWAKVKHGRLHLITDQCCKPLIDARETMNNDSGSQGTIIQYMWCEWMCWSRTPHKIFQSTDNDEDVSPRVRKISIDVCNSQGIQGSL